MCSKRTREAVERNNKIISMSDRAAVMTEILNGVLTYLHRIFGSDNPRKSHTIRIAQHLGTVYPALFRDEDLGPDEIHVYHGYGLGGLRGLKGLPDRICNMYRDKFNEKKRKKLINESEDFLQEDEEPNKRGKKKLMYGVNNQRFYATNNSKSSLEALKTAGKIEQFETREQIFEDNRSALMKLMRNKDKMVSNVCEGFWRHPKHVENHFYYLTDTEISSKIRQTLVGHLEYMEEYLVSVNNSVEFSNTLEKTKEDCAILYGGSLVHKYIHILRLVGDFFDGDGSALMRLLSDGPPKHSSPHMYAVYKEGSGYVFELWVEQQGLLFDLDMAACVSAFLHTSFCFGLKYPSKAETVCDFLQRDVACYGSDEGTMTSKSVNSAQTKLMRYHLQLGKILSAKKFHS